MTNNANPMFGFSADEPDSTFECSLSKGAEPDAFAPCSSPKGYGPLSDGAYTFKVKATDAARNIGEAASYSFRVDSTKPAAPSQPDLVAASDTGGSNTDNITNDSAPRFQGNAEAGSRVSVYDGARLLGEVTASSAGGWTLKVAGPLEEGDHRIRAQATDAAGNVSVASAALNVTIDLTKPLATNLAPAPGSSTSNRTPTIAATVKDDRTDLSKGNIVFKLDGAQEGSFSYDRTLDRLTYKPKKVLSFGSHTVEVRVEDAAGNQASQTWRFSVVR